MTAFIAGTMLNLSAAAFFGPKEAVQEMKVEALTNGLGSFPVEPLPCHQNARNKNQF